MTLHRTARILAWSTYLCCVCPLTLGAATLNHLALPSTYDNAREDFGQTFVAVDDFVSGVSMYIGDPFRPGIVSVGELLGPADLVLWDATDLGNPIELHRTQVLSTGVSTSGLTTFLFDSLVPTVVGARYFFGITTADLYGIGIRELTSSTYAGGAEAYRNCALNAPCSASFAVGALIELDEFGRDLSFAVYGPEGPPAPEPATTGLLLLGIATAVRRIRRQRG